ncbi:MAG: hypothetical protein ACKO2G_02900 [Verrucomicrobiales bacterium]
MSAPFRLLLAGVFALAALPAVAEDEAVNVRLQRPMKVGLRFNEVTTATYEQTAGIRGLKGLENARKEKWTIHFDADQEVLEVTPRGSPKAYQLKFKSLTRADEKGKKKDLLPAGSVVHGKATPGGGAVFILEENGEPLEDTLQGTLGDLFGMSDADDSPSMDELYATAGPRKYGDEWPLDTAVARKLFGGDERLLVGLSGGCRLLNAVKVDGVPCYRIGTSVSTRSRSNLRFQGMGMGDDTEYLSAMVLTLPADNTSMERGYTSFKRQKYSGPMDFENGASRSEVTIESNYDTAIRPLPPAPERQSKDPESPAPEKKVDEEEHAEAPGGGES